MPVDVLAEVLSNRHLAPDYNVVELADAFAEEPWIAARDVAIVLLMYGAGMRIGEVLGLTLGVAHEAGRTGVDYVAVGALTHSSPILDVGADLREGT